MFYEGEDEDCEKVGLISGELEFSGLLCQMLTTQPCVWSYNSTVCFLFNPITMNPSQIWANPTMEKDTVTDRAC